MHPKHPTASNAIATASFLAYQEPVIVPNTMRDHADGSSLDVALPGEPTPAAILAKMLHDLWLHAHNVEH